METSFLSIGLIHRYDQEQSQYLVRKQDSDELWSPIVGQRLEKESFRETIIREIGWVLELDRRKDFLVSNMSITSQEYVQEEAPENRHYAIAFYRAKLFTRAARQKIDEDQRNIWVSPQQLCDGVIRDQQKIDPEVVSWINRWSVLNPWE